MWGAGMGDGAEPVPDTADVMFVLRRRTATAHTRLESVLQLTGHDLSVSRYRDVLMRMHGFYDLLEPRLDAMLDVPGSPVPDWPSRRKTPLLRRDLAVLGVAEATLAALPRPKVPAVPDVAAAMGVLYVFEGATLGGRFIVEQVASTEVPAAATAFFGSYGDEVGRRWSQLRHALRAWSGADEARVAACADTAEALFGALEVEFSR